MKLEVHFIFILTPLCLSASVSLVSRSVASFLVLLAVDSLILLQTNDGKDIIMLPLLWNHHLSIQKETATSPAVYYSWVEQQKARVVVATEKKIVIS